MSTYENCQFHVEDDDQPCQTCTRLVVTDITLDPSATAVQVWAQHVVVGKVHILKLSDTKKFCPVTAATLKARVRARTSGLAKVKGSKPSPKKK